MNRPTKLTGVVGVMLFLASCQGNGDAETPATGTGENDEQASYSSAQDIANKLEASGVDCGNSKQKEEENRTLINCGQDSLIVHSGQPEIIQYFINSYNEKNWEVIAANNWLIAQSDKGDGLDEFKTIVGGEVKSQK